LPEYQNPAFGSIGKLQRANPRSPIFLELLHECSAYQSFLNLWKFRVKQSLEAITLQVRGAEQADFARLQSVHFDRKVRLMAWHMPASPLPL